MKLLMLAATVPSYSAKALVEKARDRFLFIQLCFDGFLSEPIYSDPKDSPNLKSALCLHA